MRIAYVCTDLGVPVFGSKGASVHVQEVLSVMTKLGAAITLFSSSIGGHVPTQLENVVLSTLPNWPEATRSSRALSVERANDMLRSKLQLAGPFDLVYERYSLWSYAPMEYAKTAGIPGILEVNSPLIEEQARYRQLDDREAAEQLARRVFASARNILAVSSGVANYLASYPETEGRVQVIGNGVNEARFPANTKPTRPGASGTFTIGFLGSLKPWHGLNTLVDAYALLTEKAANSRLLVVGDGPERERLAYDLAARGLLESSEFTGMVPPSDVPGLLASMDVGVAPYPNLDKFYFSPLKVFEYMAAGLPVVTSRVGDLPDLIQDGEDGFVVPPGDSVALANKLDLLRSDQGLRARMGRTARSKVLRYHTWDMVVRRILDLSGISAAPKIQGS